MKDLSVLKLFKGYIGEKVDGIHKEGLRYGLLIPLSASKEVCADAIELYGKDGEKWNWTFHKSWNKVATAPIEQLIYEQLVNYLTTYGFEDLGIFSHESVYIPHEKLDIPELSEDIELISIRPYAKQEVSDKLMVLLSSGIALGKDTIACVTDLAELIDVKRFEEIKNREVRVALCDIMGIAPEDPDEFLRYIIYKATGSTLKIQNDETIGHLKLYSRRELLELFKRYLKEDEDGGMRKLASVFFRNKKLFLAMKTSAKDLESPGFFLIRHFKERPEENEEIGQLNHLINRLRKLADKYHKPLPLNRLDRLTSASVQIDEKELEDALDSITVFREIRIVNGLSYRLSENKSIVYKIRNGRSFATEKKPLCEEERELIARRYMIAKQHLINRLRPQLSGKIVCLPEECNYKAPASEKQFVGDFPCGTCFELKHDCDLIFGIHWTNLESDNKDDERCRVDLDLHLQNLQTSYGWNSAYRDDQSEIYYSGDMTDAPLPEGASELFYIGQDIDSSFVFSVNKYTSNEEAIPFEIVVAKSEAYKSSDDFEDHYMIDPNNILLKIPMEILASENMMRLGFVYITDEMIKVVLNSFNSGRMIVSANDDPVFVNTFNYIQTSQNTSLDLKDVLKLCGATIVDKTYDGEADFDLSMNKLNKETIIAILSDQK